MTWRAWTVFAVLCVVWGIPYFFIKLALEEIPPVGVAWARIALGAAILMPIAWKRGVLGQARAHMGAILAFAFVELVIPFFLISQGESWISSSLTGILIATVPLTVVLFSPLFGIKERLGRRRLAGLVLGFIGVIALLGIDPPEGPLQWAGVACMLISVSGYAIGSLIVQRYLSDIDEQGAVALSLLIASIVLLPPAVLTAPASIPSLKALMAVVVLGVICTALALQFYFYLIAKAGASRASIITYINPAVAALLGVVVLDEHFGLGTAVGFVLILVGSWLGTRGAKQH
jgi:drug/metabolite transporter (DMT)-like permease